MQFNENVSPELLNTLKTMSRKEVDDLLKTMNEFRRNAVHEVSLMSISEIMTLGKVESLYRRDGFSAVEEYSESAKNKFIERYRDDTSAFGDWRSAGESLIEQIAKEEK